MGRIWLGLAGLVAMLSGADVTPPLLRGSFSQASLAGTQVRLMDWNIERGTNLDGIVAEVRKQKADICLFQEVDLNARRTSAHNIADDLARELRMNYIYGASFQELGQGTEEQPAFIGQAILANGPLQRPRNLRFAYQTGFWEPRSYVPSWAILQRRLGGRTALIAEIEVGGKRLVLYNLHLESRGFGKARFRQLKEALADAKQYAPDVPVVFAGDLNTKYRADLFVEQLTGDGFHSCFGEEKVRTHKIIGALDWVFVRGPLTCEGAIVDRNTAASDHYPIVTTISMAP